MKSIGETISSMRIARNLTQQQFADAAGISQPHLSGIEAGKYSPNLKTMGLISRAFGVSLSELTGL